MSELLVVSLLLMPSAAFAPAPQRAPVADRLGMTCAQILRATSSKWISDFQWKKGESPENTVRAIAVYRDCYEARTDRLAASLGKAPGGTPPGAVASAVANFRTLDSAVKIFVAKALASTDPPADAVKSAYAALYEKQFRYDFYRTFEQKTLPPASSPEELEAVGEAKTEFGKQLNALPADKMRDVHAAFSRIFDTSVSDSAKLVLYRFAIFCLEKPSATPYSRAPF